MSDELLAAFGKRAVRLHSGELGLRGSLSFDVKQATDLPTEPVLDFVASDSTLDRYNEVIDQAGWDFAGFRKNPVCVNCHNYDSIIHILGNIPVAEVRGGKLVNRVKFAVANPLGKMAYDMAKAGFIPTQSVGFIPKAWKDGVEKGEPDRTFTKQELLEISLTVVPANPNASQLAMAFKSGAIEKSDLQEAAKLLRSLCNENFDGGGNADPGGDSRAKAAGVDVAQMLSSMRAVNQVLKHT